MSENELKLQQRYLDRFKLDIENALFKNRESIMKNSEFFGVFFTCDDSIKDGENLFQAIFSSQKRIIIVCKFISDPKNDLYYSLSRDLEKPLTEENYQKELQACLEFKQRPIPHVISGFGNCLSKALGE